MAKALKEPVVFIPKELIFSKAFTALRGNSVKVILYLYVKRAMDDSSGKWLILNNGKITLRYEEIPHLSNGAKTAAIDDLIAKGFISIARRGGKNIPTEFNILEDWKRFGEPDFNPTPRIKRSPKNNKFKPRLVVAGE